MEKMAKRAKMSRKASARSFKRGLKTRSVNIAPRTQRGGIRL